MTKRISRSERARRYIKRNAGSSLNSWAFIGFQGDPVYSCRKICFSGLGGNWNGRKIQWFLDWNPSRQNDKAGIEYADYVINRSPLSSVFVDKDPEMVVSQPTLYNTKHTARAIVSGAIMLRYLREHVSVVEHFHRMRQQMPEDSAFLVPHLFNWNSAYNAWTPRNAEFYHSFHSHFSRDRLNNWFNHRLPHDLESYWMYHGQYFTYRDLSNTFGKSSDLRIEFPTHLTKKIKINSMWGDESIGMFPDDDMGNVMRELLKINDITIEDRTNA